MSRVWKWNPLVILLLPASGFVVWIIYATFVGGTTSGPDFVQALTKVR
jgi:hypothetical protein